MSEDTPSTDDTQTHRQAETTRPEWAVTDESLIEALETEVHPLETTEPSADGDDLAPIGAALGRGRVIALGEATHGTREFFQLKHRLIRRLVTEQGVRLLALEANFTETLAIDEYVTFGRGDPRDALEGIYFWTWNTEEVLALLEWLREFNDGQPLSDRVRFYGIDTQYTAGPAERLEAFCETHEPELRETHSEVFKLLTDEQLGDKQANTGLTAEDATQYAAVEELLDAIESVLEEHAPDDEKERRLLRRHYWSLEQAVEYYRDRQAEDPEAAIDRRDRAMAATVTWLLDHESRDRIVVWAHDGHVQRSVRDRRWGTAPSMGTRLAERFGNEYYALGFDFATGTFRAVDLREDHELVPCSLGAPPAEAATRLFAAAKPPRWVLDFDRIDDSRLADWLDRPRAVRSVGWAYDDEQEHGRHHNAYRLPEAFDGLAFVRKTTSAIPVDGTD